MVPSTMVLALLTLRYYEAGPEATDRCRGAHSVCLAVWAFPVLHAAAFWRFRFHWFRQRDIRGCGEYPLWRLLLRGPCKACASGTRTAIAGMDQLPRFGSEGAVKVEVERVECGAMEAGRRSGDDGILESSSLAT